MQKKDCEGKINFCRTNHVMEHLEVIKLHTLGYYNSSYVENRRILTAGGESTRKTTYGSVEAEYHKKRQRTNKSGNNILV